MDAQQNVPETLEEGVDRAEGTLSEDDIRTERAESGQWATADADADDSDSDADDSDSDSDADDPGYR